YEQRMLFGCLTDGKIGMEVQCRGVADALGLDYVHKQVTPNWLSRLLSPWMPPRFERLGSKGSILAPEHDRLRGANVITTTTAPHSFSQARLSQLRHTMPTAISALPAPRVAVFLGGPSGAYTFTGADQRQLAGALASLEALEVSFLITPSRRTP